MRFLYLLSVRMYQAGIFLASPFNKKAKLWVEGRKNIFAILENTFQKKNEFPLIWIHCASLGEFEQGRPLIEKIKTQNENCKILLSFFSPSGYEAKKKYALADYIFYLPIDSEANAKRWIEIIQPQKAFFIKYEFWYNYLEALKKKNIPTYLVSGIFRSDQYFFQSYGSWAAKQLKCFTHFFVQDEHSEKLLDSIGYRNTTISGDTRFDRVANIVSSAEKLPLIEAFAQNKKILVGGSTWRSDEEIIYELQCIKHHFKLIIAPHEIDEAHLARIEQLFSANKTLRYSYANAQSAAEADVLIIDNIGLLSSVYRYGNIAWIGGGFGKGIHNILEAAAFGMPVIFGPTYQKFSEAKELIEKGGAFSVKDSGEAQRIFNMLSEDLLVLKIAAEISKTYSLKKRGATDIIYQEVFGSR